MSSEEEQYREDQEENQAEEDSIQIEEEPIEQEQQEQEPQQPEQPVKEKYKEYQTQANRAFAEERFIDAIRFYTLALENSDQTNSTLFSNRSAAYYKLGEYQSSLKDAIKAMQLKPDWPKAIYRVGQALIGLGKYTEALQILRRGLELDPDSDQMKSAFTNARFMAMQLAQQKSMKDINLDKAPKLEIAYTDSSIEECISSITFSPDGNLLAVSSLDGAIILFETETGKQVRKLKGHQLGTNVVCWNPDGKKIVSGGQDGQARVWDVETGKQISAVKGGATWVEHAVWVKDPDTLTNYDHFVTASGKFLKLWKAETGTLVRTFTTNNNTISGLVWNENANQIATTGYSLANSFALDKENPVKNYVWKGSMISIVWSNDMNWVICGCQENCIHLWDTRTEMDLMMQGYRRKVKEIAMDPSSRFLATGGGAECMVWDFSGEGPAGTSPFILEGHTGIITDTQFCPLEDLQLLATSGRDGRTFVWNMQNDQPELAFGLALREGLQNTNQNSNNEDDDSANFVAEKVAWHPKGKYLCTGYSDGQIIVFRMPKILAENAAQ